MTSPLTVAVTGAGSGIGLRAAAELAHRGHTVLAIARNPGRAQSALDRVTGSAPGRLQVIPGDLSDPDSISAAADLICSRGPLDALINNAANFDLTLRRAQRTSRGHELIWATNHLGPWELTARLSPALAASARPHVVFVASKGLITMPRIRIRWDALDGEGWYTPVRAYYHAKLAQVMTAQTLAERVAGKVGVSCIRVPAVRLDPERQASLPPLQRMLYAPKNAAAADPAEIAHTYVEAVEREEPFATPYRDERLRPVPLPRFAADPDNRHRLWETTAAAVGPVTWAW